MNATAHFLALFTLIGLSSCNVRLHPSALSYTSQSEVYQTQLYSTLGVSHSTFGDVAFDQRKRQLRREARRHNLNGLLAHGETFADPHYTYWVLANPDTSALDLDTFAYRCDTTVNGVHVVILFDERYRDAGRDVAFICSAFKAID
jgi:hypothetical protein